MLALLLVLARVVPKVPGPLVAVALGVAASAAFGFAAWGVRFLGRIPAGLPTPAIPAVSGSDWQPLAAGAVGLALISYNSAMVTARGFAVKNRYDLDPNREFVALGAANIGAGLLRGFAVSGADSRTAVNDSMGGKSQVTGLVAAAMLALALLFLTGALSRLPMVVLAAVLIKAALGLFDWRGLTVLRRVSPREFRLCLITLLGVITVGVLPGVVVAVGVAIVQLLMLASQPHDAVLGRVPGTNDYHDTATHPQAETFGGLMIYRFDSSLVFFNADRFKARARAVVREAPGPVRSFLLDAGTMPYVDTTGAACIDQVRADLEREGIAMAIADAKGPVRAMLERAAAAGRMGPVPMFSTVASAVKELSKADPFGLPIPGGT